MEAVLVSGSFGDGPRKRHSCELLLNAFCRTRVGTARVSLESVVGLLPYFIIFYIDRATSYFRDDTLHIVEYIRESAWHHLYCTHTILC